jgi:protein phosphatase
VTLVARHAAQTDIGLHRSTNEDAFVAAPPLFAVADGMGGAQAGEVASQLALDSLVEALAAGDTLPDAALSANARVHQRSRGDRAHSGMGTTLTATLLHGDRLEFVHVGDSRLYLWRDETLEQVTDDHSLVGEMVREGHLTRQAALSHPQRSILSRALGTESRVEIDAGEVELRAGDAVVLCSDGLYSMASETTIAAVLAAVDDPLRAARQLVREAKNEGGHDNITVIVLRFDEAGAGDGDPADQVTTITAPAAAGAEATTGSLPVLDAAARDAAARDASVRDVSLDAAADTLGDAPLDAAADAPSDSPAAALGDAPSDSPAAAPVVPPLDAGPAAAPSRRRHRFRLAVVLVALLVVCLVAGAAVADGVYFVGAGDGMVSVYHGLPWQIGGVRLYGLYLETTTPVAVVAPGLRARVERHDLHRKAAALALARQAQGLP